jgi:hypothetical protein
MGAFHGGNMGSSPIGRASDFKGLRVVRAVSVLSIQKPIEKKGPRARATGTGRALRGVEGPGPAETHGSSHASWRARRFKVGRKGIAVRAVGSR